MNYIRGAVNAISAPYQYYKELPPINPSTLTGAIDVIVIQRLANDGSLELVCSPFHVRFGKWQVLRPGEKKVSVSVNGDPIPYGMKIGEAGEAFFVFETDEDVPEDLITSPILEPTRPDDQPQPGTPQLPSKEPEFLDLNATSSPIDDQELERLENANLTPRQTSVIPAFIRTSAEQVLMGPNLPPVTERDPRTPIMEEQDRRADKALEELEYDLPVPTVEYHHDLALDARGYHSVHGRDGSERTVRSSDDRHSAGDSDEAPSQDGQDRLLPTGLRRRRDEDYPAKLSHNLHMLRATSEPPPDLDIPQRPSDNQPGAASVEYSWEWGAFPQASPIKTTFNIPGRDTATWSKGKAKSRMSIQLTGSNQLGSGDSGDETEGEGQHHPEHGRSRSVPPALEGSPTKLRRMKGLPAHYQEYDEEEEEDPGMISQGAIFVAEGQLLPSKTNPAKFILLIEGKKASFELSIPSDRGGEDQGSPSRGRRNRDGAAGGVQVFDERDEVEAARLFERGRVDFHTFLEDSDIVLNPNLAIRWAPNQYITRHDGSPLLSALERWRENTLQRQRAASRPLSPTSDSDEEQKSDVDEPAKRPLRDVQRSKSEPLGSQVPTVIINGEKMDAPTTAKSSWVHLQWWNRNRRKEAAANKSSSGNGATTTTSILANDSALRRGKDIPQAESAPALPSTPIQKATSVPPVKGTSAITPKRRFAKTLRLTSDQLKALSLKPGPNTITFSLSATGAVACTARIFVWEYTDLVVISDIDGTITKSDGLGHVFAMIGRDWTHLGVAKLYTDISRNGYKIMYLTSRAIGQADATRDYLKGIKQNNYQLPEGPVIMSPDRLMASLHREVIMRKPELFKMACLRDIRSLFGDAARNPFYAGFGNRITDALSYRSVNVPSSRIFTIDSSGEVKLELLELAGYKSSYIHMTDLVDQMFPPIHRKWAPEYTDFNFWRPPVQDYPLPDLSPPSPALSARSDLSNQSTLSRFRNFRLGRASTSMLPPPAVDPSAASYNTQGNGEGDLHNGAAQMSSFERISSTLGFPSRRSLSPSSASSSSLYADDEDEEGIYEEDGRRRRRSRDGRERRRSMASMPGSLDDRDFGFDEYEEHEHEYEEMEEGHMNGAVDGEGIDGEEELHGEEEMEAGDEEIELDDAVFDIEEMNKVPFLF
ncbi:LNS2-domain-containing protein [Pluteus cervinus]|uniref:LNS2-domain-containing protein n=1 Tax=Pluteus cervinus TaxID=181527 RepID=A0ACD3AGU2_9AGAR|nr:LNS2-domain-containing protein [Pluteus cervinus]